MIILAGLAPELKRYTLKLTRREEKRAGSNDRKTRREERRREEKRAEERRGEEIYRM